MADHDRVGNGCWYKIANLTNRTETKWRRGIVLAWSTDHEEYESGPGPVPVAVVEDSENGQVRSIYVTRVNFSDEQPKQEEPV